MKKKLALVLCALLCCFAFAGCGEESKYAFDPEGLLTKGYAGMSSDKVQETDKGFTSFGDYGYQKETSLIVGQAHVYLKVENGVVTTASYTIDSGIKKDKTFDYYQSMVKSLGEPDNTLLGSVNISASNEQIEKALEKDGSSFFANWENKNGSDVGLLMNTADNDMFYLSVTKAGAATSTASPQSDPSSVVYETELGSGNYTAGIDFPAGKYDITAISGNGNVSSDNMMNGGINAIMGVKEDDLHEKSYSNISLPDGVVLQISGGVTVKIHSDAASGAELKTRTQPNTEEISLGSGNHVAGTDFPAGTYDIVAQSGRGNVSSDNLLYGGINAIMGAKKSDFYEKEYKNIVLPAGTTLKVDGVKIKLVPSK